MEDDVLRVQNPESEIPGLYMSHYEQLVTGSAISPEIVRERGYRTVFGKSTLKDLGFARQQQRFPGLLIPIYPPGMDKPGLHQYKPDNPREQKDGKKIKYETPADAGLRIDCPPRCQEALRDPLIPLWITEGVKKADSLASRGLCAIALMGVWGWRGTNDLGGKMVLADMGNIAWNGRQVYLVFDSDIITKTAVEQALKGLAMEAERRGAPSVFIVPLEGGPNGE